MMLYRRPSLSLMTLAIAGVMHTGKRRKLLAKIKAERVLVRCAAAFDVGVPLVDVVAAADDAEVTGEIGTSAR